MQTIKLNLIPGSVLPVVNVSQYDEGRQFSLSVYEGASTYDLTGKSVQIRGTKPDGNGFAYDAQDGAVSVSGNTVTISTTQQMTAVGGHVMTELRITSGQTILGTLNFIIDVENSALSDDTPISDTDIPVIERDFQAALDEAEADALKAEGHAQGTQDGTPVGSGSPYYQNNAKYYKEQADTDATNAGNSATSAAADALKSEGYAVGKQNGTAVQSGSPYYQNNAQYFDTHASEQAYNASQSATAAAADSLEAEGWAVGEQNGTPVSSGSPYYQNNAEYYCQQASQYATGGLIFKGSVAFANIPATGMASGDMYNITDDFTTDSRFIEGSGISVRAGANIAWVAGGTNKWDILATGGSTTLNSLTDVDITSAADGDLLQYDATGQEWVNSAKIPQKVAGLQKTGCANTLETTMIDHVVSGITFTVTKDGISSVGTNASSQYDIGELVGNYTPPVSGAYKLLGCPSGGSATTYWLEIIDDTTGVNLGSDTGNGLIVTLDATHSYRVRIKIGKSLPAPSGMWKPMITPDLSATYADYQPYSMTNRELTERKVNLIGTNTWNFYNSPGYEVVNVTKTILYDGWFIMTVYCQGLTNVNSNLTVLLNNATVARVGQNSGSSITMILPVILPVKAGDTLSLQGGAGSSCYVTSNVFH